MELDHQYVQTVQLASSIVAFTRVFSESIGIFYKDDIGLVISVDCRYENKVIPWLRDGRTSIWTIFWPTSSSKNNQNKSAIARLAVALFVIKISPL